MSPAGAELLRLLDAPLMPHGSHAGGPMPGCLACVLAATARATSYTPTPDKATAPVPATPGPPTPEGATT